MRKQCKRSMVGEMTMKVRNRLYAKTDYCGKEVDARDAFCPCRPCWHIYHFPHWLFGKRIDHFDCVTRHNQGCPHPLPRPLHIFYYSKRFRKRKKGDIFRCLRCGQEIRIGIDECDWITVPFRKKEKIREFLQGA